MPVYACICLFTRSRIRLHVSITVHLCNPVHPHVDSLTVYVRANMPASMSDGWMDGWMDRWMAGCRMDASVCVYMCILTDR